MMGYAGLDRDRVVGEMEDAVHPLHVDHGAAVVAVHARGGMHRARRADRRGKAHLVDHDLDDVLGAFGGRDHLGMVSPGAVPGLYGDVALDIHNFPQHQGDRP